MCVTTFLDKMCCFRAVTADILSPYGFPEVKSLEDTFSVGTDQEDLKRKKKSHSNQQGPKGLKRAALPGYQKT